MRKQFFYTVSFFEGAAVMAAELIGAKVLAPYFGSSLYVWASVLAITLVGLAAGYFIGGRLSEHRNRIKILGYVLFFAAFFTCLMPFIAKYLLPHLTPYTLLPSVILSGLIILLPPLFMMGTVSPIIISIIASNGNETGKISGNVYAVSTIGGILGTFAFGFAIIPVFGLTVPAILVGLVIGIFAAIIFLKNKSLAPVMFLVITIVYTFYLSVKGSENPVVIYEKEGLLGQMMIMDYPEKDSLGRSIGSSRYLLINRITQTKESPAPRQKYFTYVHDISAIVDTFPRGSNMLLIGMGGGSVVKEFADKGFNVDVCELDKRMIEVSEKYFNVHVDDLNITIDDGRRFLNACTKKFDIIILDIFKGEEPPNHMLTFESVDRIKQLMNPGALLFINSHGYISGDIGKGTRAMYNTLTEGGLKVSILATESNESRANNVFIASLDRVVKNRKSLDLSKYDFSDAPVLKDEYPVFDKLNAQAAMAWRLGAIYSFRYQAETGYIPLFN